MQATGVRPTPVTRPSSDDRRSRAGRTLSAAARDPAIVLSTCFAVALLTRLVGLHLVHTSDEGYWLQRTVRFAAALERGDLASTFRSGHPGVTVMWVGLAGIGPERLAALTPGRLLAADMLETRPGYLGAVGAARLAVAAVTALLTAVAIGLAWRLLGYGPGLLGGLVLLLDPYVVGMTRLLHVDALLAPLMTISALAGLVWWSGGAPRYLVLSAVAGGLALLTKAPALYLPLYFGGVGLLATRPWRSPWRWLMGLPTWGALAALAYVALWPSMWVDAPRTVERVLAFARSVGGQPHGWSNFFLGGPVADPGLLFYPVALAYRLGPIALAGLVLALGLAARRRPGGVPTAAWLGLYALGFVALMTIGSKKLDRYMLPAIMVLDLLAGVGLWLLLRRVRARGIRSAVLAGLIVAQVGLLWSAYPYPLAAYNPLLGGAAGAREVLMVGWGEGLEQVAAYLNARPGAERLSATTHYHHVLRPLFRGTTVRVTGPLPRDYFVVYVNMAQRQLVPPAVQRFIAGRRPEFTAMVHGVEYAWVYELPVELRQPLPGQPVDEPADEESAE